MNIKWYYISLMVLVSLPLYGNLHLRLKPEALNLFFKERILSDDIQKKYTFISEALIEEYISSLNQRIIGTYFDENMDPISINEIENNKVDNVGGL